jgi:hypothetical protein
LTDKPDRYTKDEIDKVLVNGGTSATLILYVQESNDVGLARHKVSRLINAEDLVEFIDRYLPDDLTARTSC